MRTYYLFLLAELKYYNIKYMYTVTDLIICTDQELGDYRF